MVSKHLDDLGCTLKRIMVGPGRANIPENKEERRMNVQKLLNYRSMALHIIYMDTTNIKIHVSRCEYRSRRGIRCIIVGLYYWVYKHKRINSI